MRSSWRLVGLLSLLALAGGCDTTQPLEFTEQSFELVAYGVASSVNKYAVWDMYEDGDPLADPPVPPNGQYDPGEPLYLYCEDTGEVTTPLSAPFPFKVQISILRAGELEPEVVTSNAALQLASNMTQYDYGTPLFGLTRTLSPITIDDGGTMRTFGFINADRRLVTAAREEVVAATENPLHDIDSDGYPLGGGLCSEYYPGEARIDQQPQPFPITLYKGDTVVIELRRGTNPPEGIPYNVLGLPVIRADLLLNGEVVVVQGDQVTGSEPDSGIKFSYTSF